MYLHYIPPLAGKLDQQRFTMRSGVLNNISSRQRSAISGLQLGSLPNGLCTSSLQPDRPLRALHFATFSGNSSLLNY